MKRSPTRCWPSLLSLILAFTLAGCGDDDSTTGPEPPALPVNDTPTNALVRFERTYESQMLFEYELMLTADYRFTFSSQSDPVLVNQYGDNWGKDDEVESTSHLFDGFTNEGGDFVPGASEIGMSIPFPQVVADPDFPDSAEYYKLVVAPSVAVVFAIPGTDGFEISAPHDFHLVRGDAAVLNAGQPADANRWYVRRWVDKSAALLRRAPGQMAPARVLPAQVATMGSIKALYRR